VISTCARFQSVESLVDLTAGREVRPDQSRIHQGRSGSSCVSLASLQEPKSELRTANAVIDIYCEKEIEDGRCLCLLVEDIGLGASQPPLRNALQSPQNFESHGLGQLLWGSLGSFLVLLY
jgi:hypothetical protein